MRVAFSCKGMAIMIIGDRHKSLARALVSLASLIMMIQGPAGDVILIDVSSLSLSLTFTYAQLIRTRAAQGTFGGKSCDHSQPRHFTASWLSSFDLTALWYVCVCVLTGADSESSVHIHTILSKAENAVRASGSGGTIDNDTARIRWQQFNGRAGH